MTGAAVWRVWGRNLPPRCVVARSFDEAIKKAREFDAGYCAGQIVVEDLDQPDFVSGAPTILAAMSALRIWEPISTCLS